VSSLAQIFVPMSSQSDAAGNMDRLRKIFVAGNRACAFVILPIAAAFVILGKSIIEVWVGRKYVAQGYPVLLVLILPYTLMMVQGASSRVLFGMSKHGKLAVVTLIEGVANLGLSILLVRPFGILGDAYGTAIPMAATYVLFMPRHLCSRLGIRVTNYLRQAYVLPVLLTLPMAAVLWLLQRKSMAHTYRQLIPQLLVGGVVYGLGLGWAHWTNRTLRVGDLAAIDEAPVAEHLPISPEVESFQEEL
jgi:O-antigen/teichoic acid export membrane protein